MSHKEVQFFFGNKYATVRLEIMNKLTYWAFKI